MKVYNFSAGPSMLPEEVKLQAQHDFMDYNGSGMSVVEMSHRSKVYDEIHNEAMALIRELMNISDEYYVLFLQGGGSTQFDAVPLNLLVKGKADYVVTGNFANKAYKAALRYGDIACLANTKESNYSYIPDVDKLSYREDTDYVHITTNNTIFGTQYNKLPKNCTLVTDMSSNFLGKYYDVNDFGLIYAGAQKNLGPSGLTIVIVRKNLVGNAKPYCPTMLDYKTQAEANSLYNTPVTFSTYIAMLNMRFLKKFGGIKEMEKHNKYKSSLLYDFIDNSKFYVNSVNVADRSIMNVPFVAPTKELDALFIKQAESYGIVSIKGHKLVGGMRASLYNGMPIEGVKQLIDFMKKFEIENK